MTPTWYEPGPDGPVPAPAPREAPAVHLVEGATLADLLRRWQKTHPEDPNVGPLLASVLEELEVLMGPWLVVVDEMAAQLDAMGFPGYRVRRSEPTLVRGFDGSKLVIEGAQGEPIGPTGAANEGKSE